MPSSESRGADLAVIGAAGKTGAAVVKALAERASVRRVVHTARRPGDRAVDLETGAGLADALAGCSGVYFIAPNLHPDEPALLKRTLRVAARAGVEHFVYHSVAWPYAPAMPHHLDKARCENELHTFGGVRWTVLQPCAYTENFAAVLEGTVDVLEVPYDPDALFSFVSLGDVAEAAARVLVDGPGIHHGATYELGGPETVSVRQLCSSAARSVTVSRVPVRDWMERHGQEMTADAARRLGAMFEFYDRHGFVAGSSQLHTLLGRSPSRITDTADAMCRVDAAGGVGKGL